MNWATKSTFGLGLRDSLIGILVLVVRLSLGASNAYKNLDSCWREAVRRYITVGGGLMHLGWLGKRQGLSPVWEPVVRQSVRVVLLGLVVLWGPVLKECFLDPPLVIDDIALVLHLQFCLAASLVYGVVVLGVLLAVARYQVLFLPGCSCSCLGWLGKRQGLSPVWKPVVRQSVRVVLLGLVVLWGPVLKECFLVPPLVIDDIALVLHLQFCLAASLVYGVVVLGVLLAVARYQVLFLPGCSCSCLGWLGKRQGLSPVWKPVVRQSVRVVLLGLVVLWGPVLKECFLVPPLVIDDIALV